MRSALDENRNCHPQICAYARIRTRNVRLTATTTEARCQIFPDFQSRPFFDSGLNVHISLAINMGLSAVQAEDYSRISFELKDEILNDQW